MASPSPLQSLSAITLFVEDLAASREFYTSVFDTKIAFEDESSTALKLGSLIINLLLVEEAAQLVRPHPVGTRNSGKRCQLSAWVDDLDKICEHLKSRDVKLLSGPETQPWGMRTITFEDPAGNIWEAAQAVKD